MESARTKRLAINQREEIAKIEEYRRRWGLTPQVMYCRENQRLLQEIQLKAKEASAKWRIR